MGSEKPIRTCRLRAAQLIWAFLSRGNASDHLGPFSFEMATVEPSLLHRATPRVYLLAVVIIFLLFRLRARI
jgi:hypothetical protein